MITADCHPDRQHEAHGLCRLCYMRQYRKDPKAAEANRAHVKAWRKLNAEKVKVQNQKYTRRRQAAVSACALALRWLGDPDDPTGTFEDIGGWYYSETGRLRPGKSEPLEMGGTRHEDREALFRAWCDAKCREVRAALKAAL